MKENNKKSGNSTNNSGNAESSTFRTIEKTTEQLTASASRYDERAEDGQKITFTKAEQKKASSDAKNADNNGFLPGVFWSGFVTTEDGTRHDFERLDSNGISRKFAGVCSWKRATRGTLLDGNSTRTAEQRKEDAAKAIEEAKAKPAPNSVTAMLWKLIETNCTLEDENGNVHDVKTALQNWIIDVMEKADTAAAEKAQSKESKTAKAQRELEEAKTAAAAAESATESAIKLLLATGQYKTEEEVRKALGL